MSDDPATTESVSVTNALNWAHRAAGVKSAWAAKHHDYKESQEWSDLAVQIDNLRYRAVELLARKGKS